MTGSSRKEASKPPLPPDSTVIEPTEKEAVQPNATRLFIFGFPLAKELKPSAKSLSR
jgi:hypothetical protein